MRHIALIIGLFLSVSVQAQDKQILAGTLALGATSEIPQISCLVYHSDGKCSWRDFKSVSGTKAFTGAELKTEDGHTYVRLKVFDGVWTEWIKLAETGPATDKVSPTPSVLAPLSSTTITPGTLSVTDVPILPPGVGITHSPMPLYNEK
jgi:hypothetical protein